MFSLHCIDSYLLMYITLISFKVTNDCIQFSRERCTHTYFCFKFVTLCNHFAPIFLILLLSNEIDVNSNSYCDRVKIVILVCYDDVFIEKVNFMKYRGIMVYVI